MSARLQIRAPCRWVILVLLAALLLKLTVYDSLRLAWFTHRIAQCDRIIATNWLSSMSLTMTGDEPKKLVGAIGSAGSGRPGWGKDWANIYSVDATFYKGTKALGEIETDGELFLIHYHQPPFRERTGVLRALLVKPFIDAEMNKSESQ